MKSMLTAFAAMAALAIPAGLPTLAFAQDELTADAPPPNDAGGRYQPDETVHVQSAPRQERAEVQQVQNRGDRGGRGDGGGRGDRGGGGNRDGGGGGWNGGQNNGGGDRGDRGGNRGDGGGWNRGDNNGGGRGDRGPGQGGDPRWNQPNPTPPVVTPPSQDRGGRDRDRGNGGWNGGQNNGGWNSGQNGGGRDRGNGGWNGGGRDRSDGGWNGGNDNRDRGNGGWNNGQNNGGWDRDRNGGNSNWRSDRNGRRDYNGWNNRWNQNDWRRDWNRGRSNDWWRSDRGFRGYTGYRFGFYFAPNYGYYSVPRNYWGQRWYAGDYLPSIFWRYRLNDYRTYGLGYPPPGTQWVAVDNTIYLIDSFDGYILEVIYDAWRW